MVEIIKQQLKKASLKHFKKRSALKLFKQPTVRNKQLK